MGDYHRVIELPIGRVEAWASDRGVRRIRLRGRRARPAGRDGPCAHLDALEKALRAYCEGSARRISVPLDLDGTPFQRRVWEELRRIPFGETRSYGEVARAVGSPRAARAVGAACSRNPVPLVVPCHRVVGGRSIGGWSGHPGLKERLLGHEGAA